MEGVGPLASPSAATLAALVGALWDPAAASPVSEVEIRRYQPRDADAIWALNERALRDAGIYDPEYAHLDGDLRHVRREYLEAGGEFLVGEREGQLVAMGALQPAPVVDHHDGGQEIGVIRRMRVEPDLQRRGIGREVLVALEKRAVEMGFEELVLDTTEHQMAALAFYEAHGYREVRRVETPVGELVFFEKEIP